MSNRLKEDEIIERNLRTLLKLPENRRCINCNSLGPQYVCTTFLTFVCTNCSGVHREFTHRVKSVSMAKFTAEEVSALQAAGNERARQIYLKEWDHQRQSHPDYSNLHKIREFIKHVYEDRKYTGERSDKPRERSDKPLKLKLGEKEVFTDGRKVTAYLGELRSPHYESKYEQSSSGSDRRSDDRSSRYNYDERRSPRYAKENSRYAGIRKGTARFEVVDDRFRDDRIGSTRRSGNLNITNREIKSGSRSPESQTSRNSSSSLVVRPLKVILGEDALPLDVGKIAKAITGKEADGSANKQNITPSGSLHSVDGSSVEHKNERVESLIDFDSVPAALDTAASATETKQITPLNNGGNQAPHEPLAQNKAPMAPNPNTLEFLLFELSSPSFGNNSGNTSTFTENNMAAGAVSSAAPSMQMSLSPSSNNASATVFTTNMPVQQSGGNVLAAAVLPLAPSEQMLTMPSSVDASITAPTSFFPEQPSGANIAMTGISTAAPLGQMTADSSSSTPKQTSVPVGALNSQSWALSLVPSTQGPSSASAEHTSQTLTMPAQCTSSTVGSDPLPGERESTGRMELPEDLFASSYIPAPVSLPRWQSCPPQAMGYSMQYYPNATHVPAYSNPAKSSNPFDFNGETDPMQRPQFPSMTSLQGDLPNVGLQHTSSYDSLGLMAPHSLSFSSAMSPSPFMGQQVHTNMTPSRLQGVGGFDSDRSFFGSPNTPQQPSGGYPTTTTTNSFTSTAGNPFG